MKTLHILTATAGILLTLAAPGFAASRTNTSHNSDRVNTLRTYGERDENNPQWGRDLGRGAYARGEIERPYQYVPAQNWPYSYESGTGESYGGPNGW
jgi:hypothetical protein